MVSAHYGSFFRTGTLAALLALAMAVLPGKVISASPDQRGETALAALSDMMERAYSGRDIEPPREPRAAGVHGDVEMLGRQFVYDMVRLSREYDRRMAESGLYRLLLPRRLGNDENLSESRDIINRLRANVGEYSPRHVALFAELAGRVRAADLDPVLAEPLYRSLADGAEARQAMLERSWRLERMMIERFARLIDTLDNPMTPWREVDGDLRFSTSRGSMTYNQHLQRINELGEEQLRLRQQVAESTLDSFADVLTE